MNISDKLSLSRVLLSPVIFCLYFAHEFFPGIEKIAIIVIIPILTVAELTDFFDGYMARKLQIVSDFGKIFDPLADVLLNLTLFLCFVLSGYMPAIIFLLILYREFGINFLRLMAIKKGIAIGARKGGKVKTCLYFAAGALSLLIEIFLRFETFDASTIQTLKIANTVLYCLTLAASYFSFLDYGLYFNKVLTSERQ